MAELNSEPGVDATALAGRESQFDVIVDGTTVFAKEQVGRFPEPGEIGRLLRQG